MAICVDKNVGLYSTTANWTLIRNYAGHAFTVNNIEWLTEDTIVSGADDSKIKIWSVTTGATNRTINLDESVNSLCILSDRVRLAAGLSLGNIRIYSLIDYSVLTILQGHSNAVRDMIQVSGDLLASTSTDQRIRLWNLTTNATKFIFNVSGAAVNSLKQVALDVIVGGDLNGAIRLMNITDGTFKENLLGHNGSVNTLDILDPQRLVSGGFDQTIKIWNLTSGGLLKSSNITGANIRTLAVLNSTGW